jgi:hypothetical protein
MHDLFGVVNKVQRLGEIRAQQVSEAVSQEVALHGQLGLTGEVLLVA